MVKWDKPTPVAGEEVTLAVSVENEGGRGMSLSFFKDSKMGAIGQTLTELTFKPMQVQCCKRL